MEDLEKVLEYYKHILDTEGIDDVSKLNTIIKIALIYKSRGEMKTALNYAFNGCTFTFSPRADLCCLIGDIYYEMGNMEWAVKWYRNSFNNIPNIGEETSFNTDYLFKIPSLKLSVVLYDMGEYQEAMEYAESVLKIEPENEDALFNKNKIGEKL